VNWKSYRQAAGVLIAALLLLEGLTACAEAVRPASPSGAAESAPAAAATAPPAAAPQAVAAAPQAVPAVVYSQPPSAEGGLLRSSLRDPEGSDTDQWAWDGFTFPSPQAITEITWRGGYDPLLPGDGGPVIAFTVSIYASIPSGGQPDLAQPPLIHHEVAGNAGETPAAILGGVQTYDYHYVLPQAFQAAAQTKYWLQVEALQSGAPDWGLSNATGGDGVYFRRIAGEGLNYQLVSGDTAFSLLGPGTNGHAVYLPSINR